MPQYRKIQGTAMTMATPTIRLSNVAHYTRIEPNRTTASARSQPVARPSGPSSARTNVAAVPIHTARLLRPELATLISGVRIPSAGVTRERMQVPLSPTDKVTDTVLFEDPNHPEKKYYLPQYEVVVEEASLATEARFKVLLKKTGSGGKLTIELKKIPPANLKEQVQRARELSHKVTVVLKFRFGATGGQGGAIKEFVFQEIINLEHGLTAILNVTPSELNQLYAALKDWNKGPRLLIKRVIEVGIPVVPKKEQPITPIPSRVLTSQPRRPATARSRTHERILIRRPQPRETTETSSQVQLFRKVDRTLECVVEPHPFIFEPELHPYIYSNISGTARKEAGLVLRQVQHERNWYSYYQDEADPHIFYYLPDSFKIARRPETPHDPIMSVAFDSEDDAMENMQVSLQYVATPFVSQSRLEIAADNLRSFLPASLPEDITAPVFEPLLAEDPSLRLIMPGSGKAQERSTAFVDLRSGIHDQLILNMTQFQSVYDALFSEAAALLRGEISIKLGSDENPVTEKIPLIIRMDDLVGDLFELEEIPDPQSGGLKVALRNSIESSVVIEQLPLEISRGEKISIGRIDKLVSAQHAANSLPVTLKPGEDLGLLVIPEEPLPGDDPLRVHFDYRQVKVEPDREAVWDAILDPTTPAEYIRTIDVWALADWFQPSVDQPQQCIMVILVEFENGDTVQLKADQLQVQAEVHRPISELILKQVDQGIYRYRTTIIRKSGRDRTEDWKTESSEILYPEIA